MLHHKPAVSYEETTVTLTKKCSVTKADYSVSVNRADYDRYKNGDGLIQEIFPAYTVEQREFMISGITPYEWDAMFGTEEE